MPEDENASNGDQADEAAVKPKALRVSNKAPGKKGAKTPEKDVSTEAPENEGHVTGVESGKPGQKRSNRRRRGKGKSSGQEPGQARESEAPVVDETDAKAKDDLDSGNKDNISAPREQPQKSQRPEQKPRRKLDPDKVAKNAWKIYLAEVSEEGVALIGDSDARELARRCFRLSEIFLEEEDRRS